jgi:hypothetical protein
VIYLSIFSLFLQFFSKKHAFMPLRIHFFSSSQHQHQTAAQKQQGAVTFDEIEKARGEKKKVPLSEILEMRQ